MNFLRTDNSNPDFQELCIKLDNELNSRYGKSQSNYDRHNVIEDIQTVIVGYIDGIPIASGCFKILDKESIEIKRMYVEAEHRRKGLSTELLNSLESWAEELGFSIALLETGRGQPEAINLYKKQGYKITENYDPYVGMNNSLCLKKKIKKLS